MQKFKHFAIESKIKSQWDFFEWFQTQSFQASAAAKEDDENAISVTLKTAAVLISSFLSWNWMTLHFKEAKIVAKVCLKVNQHEKFRRRCNWGPHQSIISKEVVVVEKTLIFVPFCLLVIAAFCLHLSELFTGFSSNCCLHAFRPFRGHLRPLAELSMYNTVEKRPRQTKTLVRRRRFHRHQMLLFPIW